MRGLAIRGYGGVLHPTIFILPTHLRKINRASHCVAYEVRGKSSLSANWTRTKSVCRQIGDIHPTKNCRWLPSAWRGV